MDNEHMLDRVQNLLLGMEERVNARFDRVDTRFNEVDARFNEVDARFDKVDARFDAVEHRLGSVETRLDGVEYRLGSVETKLDSVARELTLNNELLGPFIRWSHRVEDEVVRLSAQLQDVQARLAKLENPSAQ
jgi:archaellum component FlaC